MSAKSKANKKSRTAYARAYYHRVVKPKRKAAQAATVPTRKVHPLPTAGNIEDAITWIEATLVVPSGRLQGQKFKLADFQKRFLREAMAADVSEAGLSIGRKNAKSATVAALIIAHLVGPLNRLNWRAVVISLTAKLATELRDQIEQIKDASGLDIEIRKAPVPGSAEGFNNARCDILASDKSSSGHSIGCDLAVFDELGLTEEANRELCNRLYQSVSTRDGRFIAISVQGRSPLFAEMKERSLTEPGVVFHEYTSPDDCDINDPKMWALSNPGIAAGIKSATYMKAAARRASLSPANALDFRAMDLNMRVDPRRQSLCNFSDWAGCLVDELPPATGPVCAAWDLGGSTSMSCFSAYWVETGRLEVWGGFPCEPDLAERGKQDRVGDLYQRMEEGGELQVYPGRVTPAMPFLEDCAIRMEEHDIIACGADRVRRAEALQALDQVGLSWPMTWRGIGASAFADGSHDVRSFQKMVLAKRIAYKRDCLMLTSAVGESYIRYDSSGINPAIDKRRSGGRIDACQASVIAAGLASLIGKPNEGSYLGLAG